MRPQRPEPLHMVRPVLVEFLAPSGKRPGARGSTDRTDRSCHGPSSALVASRPVSKRDDRRGAGPPAGASPSVPATGSSSTRSLGQEPDRSAGPGEPETGLPQDQRGGGLGVDVSATTIATCFADAAPRRIGPTWRQFLRCRRTPAPQRGSIRRAGRPERARPGSAPGATRSGRRRRAHRGRRTPPRPVGRGWASAAPAVAWLRAALTALRSGARARDRPAMSA